MSDKKYSELLDKRSILENDLRNLEKSIYDLETRYLEETATTGNILRGWEGYMLSKNSKINQTNARKPKVNQTDRVFSQSSKTSPFYVLGEQIQEEEKPIVEFRAKRTKRKKNYACYKKEQENNDMTPQSSSDEFQEKKIKGSKKF